MEFDDPDHRADEDRDDESFVFSAYFDVLAGAARIGVDSVNFSFSLRSES